MTLVVLTLQKHKDGIWNTRLVDRLERLDHIVHIVTLESTMHTISNPFPSGTTLLVNRVSDASDLYKAAVSLFECCQILWNIPVWNEAYAMVSNKWCHSSLLERAGLHFPQTWRLHANDLPEVLSQIQQQVRDDSRKSSKSFLFKPNAGGFGAGIVKIDNILSDDLVYQIPETYDDMAVIQEYIPPHENKLYRVWFLLGKVQCAIVRHNRDGVDEFTTGCAAQGMCSVRDAKAAQPILTAYSIPQDVQKEIETQLLPLICHAHCGSVEYLISKENKQRYYFDVNLLSSLPLVEAIENASEVWGQEYDPWIELAKAIVNYDPVTSM
jgi:hypothetical protein